MAAVSVMPTLPTFIVATKTLASRLALFCSGAPPPPPRPPPPPPTTASTLASALAWKLRMVAWRSSTLVLPVKPQHTVYLRSRSALWMMGCTSAWCVKTTACNDGSLAVACRGR